MNGDESSEESSSSCCSKRHGLSRVRRTVAVCVNRSEVELMSQMMRFITAPHEIDVWGDHGEVFDAEVTESLLRSIQPTHKLERLSLLGINITSSPAVEFINRVFKQDLPNLKFLDMSSNPLLGAGVDSLIQHLSCAPHLDTLYLTGVKMTPQQVMDLTTAVQQHGNIIVLLSDYHDRHGNPEPEQYWPSEDNWKRKYPHLFPNSSPESAHEQEQNEGQIIESEDGTPTYESEEDHEQEAESEMALQLDKRGNLKPGDARSFGESRDPQQQEMGSQTELQDSLPELMRLSLHETELVTDPHVQPKQVSTSSPTLETRPSSQDAPFTVAVPAPSASPASTLLVRAFIPMAHGPNPGLHVRPNLSPQGHAQDQIPSPSLGRRPGTVLPPPGMQGHSVFRRILMPPPTDSEPPSTSSEDPVD